MDSTSKWQSALYAGFFAAGGSLFGKLTGRDALAFSIVQNSFLANHILIIQGLALILMISFNILNWRFFVKALHSAEQTLSATVMSAASNYFFSFIFGLLVFGEHMSLYSLIGAVFILAGLLFLCSDQGDAKVDKDKFKKDM